MNLKILFLLLLILVDSHSSKGISIYANLDDLINESDLICIGTVTKGELIENGAKYIFKINEVLKGDLTLKEITFGKYFGKAIGTKYLLMLKKSKVKNHYQIFFEGMTSFEIEYEQIGDTFYNCISISHDIIGLKSKFLKEKIKSNSGLLWNSHYYRLEDIVKYIKLINKKKH